MLNLVLFVISLYKLYILRFFVKVREIIDKLRRLFLVMWKPMREIYIAIKSIIVWEIKEQDYLDILALELIKKKNLCSQAVAKLIEINIVRFS